MGKTRAIIVRPRSMLRQPGSWIAITVRTFAKALSPSHRFHVTRQRRGKKKRLWLRPIFDWGSWSSMVQGQIAVEENLPRCTGRKRGPTTNPQLATRWQLLAHRDRDTWQRRIVLHYSIFASGLVQERKKCHAPRPLCGVPLPRSIPRFPLLFISVQPASSGAGRSVVSLAFASLVAWVSQEGGGEGDRRVTCTARLRRLLNPSFISKHSSCRERARFAISSNLFLKHPVTTKHASLVTDCLQKGSPWTAPAVLLIGMLSLPASSASWELPLRSSCVGTDG